MAIATLTLQPNPTAGKDCHLQSGSPTANSGTSSLSTVGSIAGNKFRYLVDFDLSSLPSYAVVLTATLTIKGSVYGTLGHAATVNRLTQLNWVEAEATWNNYSSAKVWTSGGGDFDAATAVAWTIPVSGSFFNIAGLAAMANDAIRHRGGILAMLLKKTDETTTDFVTFATSDAATPADRPKLVVQYHDYAGVIHVGAFEDGIAADATNAVLIG